RGGGMDDDRLAQLVCKLELRSEDAALRVTRCVVAEVVEARLADGDCFRVRERRSERRDVAVRSLVRVHAERDEDPIVALGDRDTLAPGGSVRSDRQDAGHTRLARTLDEGIRRLRTRV